ncbi:hypothetical protein DSTSK_19600 [Desulforhabdus sp. TSK]|nr:hypothetical protein DSTSK_19600 [Desulforhabdus sp. TSK]
MEYSLGCRLWGPRYEVRYEAADYKIDPFPSSESNFVSSGSIPSSDSSMADGPSRSDLRLRSPFTVSIGFAFWSLEP